MKKILLFFCLILSSFGFASCSCNKSSITYAEKEISIYENESYIIDENKIEISGKDSRYKVYILDENIAIIDRNIVSPISVGKTKIRFELENKKDVFFDVDFEVKKGKIAKSVSIEKSIVNIDISDGIITSLNRLFIENECDEIPTIVCDEDIATYDYTSGIVTAVGVGKTTIQINFLNCSISFDVNISKNYYVTLLSIDDCKLYSNSSGKLPFQLFPANANMYYFSLSEEDKDRDDFIVYSDGSYKSFGTTKITLNYFYYTAKNQRSEMNSFEVEVVEKLQDFGYEIKDEKGGVPSNYLTNCEYTLIVKVDNNLGQPALQINGDFSEKSSFLYVENIGYEIKIRYDSLGKKDITIFYNLTLGDIQNVLSKTISINVVDKSVIEVGAKWGSMTLEPNSLGKYTIYMDDLDGTRASYMAILLKINGVFDTNLQYLVYQIIDESTKVEVDKVFTPENIGEYTFEAFFDGESVGKIVVLVQ